MSLDRDKLIKILNLTQSDQDGECLAAIRMANRLLKKAEVSWEKFLSGSSGSRSSFSNSDDVFYREQKRRREREREQEKSEEEVRQARRRADERAKERQREQERKRKSEPVDKGPTQMSIRNVLDLLLFFYADNDFIQSLSEQHRTTNRLSPRQYAAMMRFYNEHRARRGEGFA